MSQQTVMEKTEPETQQVERLMIILSKGTLDMVYPAFMIATTAATMGKEVHMFFTFWGMNAVTTKTSANLKVASVRKPGSPNAEHPGHDTWDDVHGHEHDEGPNRKGQGALDSRDDHDREDLGVKLHACSTTLEVMGTTKEMLLPEVDDIVGAATMLELSDKAADHLHLGDSQCR